MKWPQVDTSVRHTTLKLTSSSDCSKTSEYELSQVTKGTSIKRKPKESNYSKFRNKNKVINSYSILKEQQTKLFDGFIYDVSA